MPDATEPRRVPWRFQITLAGLLLVIVVICLLGIPPIIAAKEKANRAACQNNLSHMYKAMHVYCVAYGGDKHFMPHTGDAFFTCLLGHDGPEHPSSYAAAAQHGMRYSISIKTYICPSTGSDERSVTPGRQMADYRGPRKETQEQAFNVRLFDPPAFLPPLATDNKGNHERGGSVLQWDGSVKILEGQEFDDALKFME